MDEDLARLLPRGVDAPRRQYGAQDSILARLVARRGEREFACPGSWPRGQSMPLVSLGCRYLPTAEAAYKVKPAAFIAAGFTPLCRFALPAPAYAINSATRTLSPRPRACSATTGTVWRGSPPGRHPKDLERDQPPHRFLSGWIAGEARVRATRTRLDSIAPTESASR